MAEVFDVIVLGVGGFGSGALFHLARRGLRVLGIDRFGMAHDKGSSHGETRIIRKAYFEHPDYVPLLFRAYDLWSELEAESQRQLFWQCGLMLAGLPESEAISGARLSARQHKLAIENLSSTAAMQRWPGFRIPDALDVVFEPEAGFLKVEECVHTHLDRAVAHGAALQLDDPVVSWTSNGHEVRVRTASREFVAGGLIITAGAWAASVMAHLKLPLQVLRKPVFWHAATSPAYALTTGMPTFYIEMPPNVGQVSNLSGQQATESHGQVENLPRAFYGFPSLDGQLLKVAEHTGGQLVANPLHVDRDCHEADIRPIAAFLQTCLPDVSPQPIRHSVCMYTITPDRHFVVDRHPEFANVAFGCGFSGHGFKFTSVLGEALADLATTGRTDLPIGFLRLRRPLTGIIHERLMEEAACREVTRSVSEGEP